MFKLPEKSANHLIEQLSKNLFADHKGRYIVFPLSLTTVYGEVCLHVKVEIPDVQIALPDGPIHDKYSKFRHVTLKPDDILG